jgi:transcriptional regulator with XRE-family HTH domain
MLDLIEIGTRLRATRRNQGISQQELSRLSGVSRARIDALENGRAFEIGFKHLTRLLTALHLELRLGEANQQRPTLDDLEKEASDDSRLD